jgi:hypothetical protein
MAMSRNRSDRAKLTYVKTDSDLTAWNIRMKAVYIVSKGELVSTSKTEDLPVSSMGSSPS